RRPSHLGPEGHGRRAAGASAGAASARQLQLRSGGGVRRPCHDRRYVVRAAGAVQAGGGDLEPGSAIPPDPDRFARARAAGRRGDRRMSIELERTLEALLFLSAEPVDAEALADATGVELHEVVTALERLREYYEFERRGLVLRPLGGG